MKSAVLLMMLVSFGAFAQKTQNYTFEDGTEVTLTRYFNNPVRVAKFSIVANYTELILNRAASGITLVPKYRLSDELFIDAQIFFPAFGDGNAPSDEIFLEAGSSTFNFSPQLHYELFSTSKSKETPISVKYESGNNENIRYVVNLPILYKKALLLDGGLNYSQFSVNKTFAVEQPLQYRLVGQSALSLLLGVSYYKASHHRLKIENKVTKNYLKESRLSLALLFGAPTSSKVVSFVDSTGIIESVDFNPSETDFEKPTFYNFGVRLNLDNTRAFARKPNILFNYGFGIGLEPSYSVIDTQNPQGERALYGMIKIGFGFGTTP